MKVSIEGTDSCISVGANYDEKTHHFMLEENNCKHIQMKRRGTPFSAQKSPAECGVSSN